MSIEDIWASGYSTTKRGWLTNPLRNGLFVIARPYFTAIHREINQAMEAFSVAVVKLEEAEKGRSDTFSAAVAKLDEADRCHSDDAAASQRLSSALKEEMQRFQGLLDGLHKNQLAWAHRLGNLEDGVEAVEEGARDLRDRHQSDESRIDVIEGDIEALKERIERLSTPVGTGTLLPSHPIAVPGTSLVLSSGPFGFFLLRQPDLISDDILAGAFWDLHLKPVIERAARFDGSAIDAGAYLGFHSIYMARLFHAVHAFEPQVENYRMLCANLVLNKCGNVSAVNSALYDVPGYLRFVESIGRQKPPSATNGTVNDDRVGDTTASTLQITDETDPRKVCAQTIDQLNLTDLALIKIDTQGSDLHVLKGASASIQRSRPIITAEYERELARSHGNTLEEYHQYFDEMAYDVQIIDSRNGGNQVNLLATPR